MAFSDIPIRSNGEDILAGWFNTIRTELLGFSGGGGVAQTTFALTDGAGPLPITGMLCDSVAARTYFWEYDIYRNTTGGGAIEFVEAGLIIASYKATAAAWTFSQGPVHSSAGVTFSIVSGTGQFEYTATSETGTPDVFEITFTARSIDP